MPAPPPHARTENTIHPDDEDDPYAAPAPGLKRLYRHRDGVYRDRPELLASDIKIVPLDPDGRPVPDQAVSLLGTASVSIGWRPGDHPPGHAQDRCQEFGLGEAVAQDHTGEPLPDNNITEQP